MENVLTDVAANTVQAAMELRARALRLHGKGYTRRNIERDEIFVELKRLTHESGWYCRTHAQPQEV